MKVYIHYEEGPQEKHTTLKLTLPGKWLKGDTDRIKNVRHAAKVLSLQRCYRSKIATPTVFYWVVQQKVSRLRVGFCSSASWRHRVCSLYITVSMWVCGDCFILASNSYYFRGRTLKSNSIVEHCMHDNEDIRVKPGMLWVKWQGSVYGYF